MYPCMIFWVPVSILDDDDDENLYRSSDLEDTNVENSESVKEPDIYDDVDEEYIVSEISK